MYLLTCLLLACLLTYFLTYLLTYLLTHSLNYLLTYLLTHSLTHSLTHLLTYLLTHSLTHSLTQLLTYLLTYSFLHSLTDSLTHSFTHSHTPWSRVLLEKLTSSQLGKKFTKFYGTRKFITAFASAHHLSLSWARSIHSIPPHPPACKSILILLGTTQLQKIKIAVMKKLRADWIQGMHAVISTESWVLQFGIWKYIY